MSYRVWTFPSVPADPFEFWKKIHQNPKVGFFLGSGASLKSDHLVYLSAGEPRRLFSSARSRSLPWHQLRKEARKESQVVPRFVGFLRFDEGRFFDPGIARLPTQPDPLQMPSSFLADYPSVVKIDFQKKKTVLYSKLKNDSVAQEIEKYFLRENPGQNSYPTLKPINWRRQQESRRYRAAFKKMVQQAKAAISRGDIYQANLSLRFGQSFKSDPIELYRLLCLKNPSPYACLLKIKSDWIVSNSPEVLVRVDGRKVITRPIAGTRPRGNTKPLDRRHQGQLLLSPKERAEHIMLVDLERNDLGRVCVPGSVRVTDRYQIEKYSHVMHIVSEVKGLLRRNATAIEAVKALFPGGTITGCPKIKAIEIIESLEKKSRGVFYGSAGYFCENGDAQFNILIRTAFLKKKKLYIQAGAGIVADSHPEREFLEILAKARALQESVAAFRYS